MKSKAVVLLSGGLDSATALAFAKNEGFDCCALTVDYGQRNKIEISRAKIIAEKLGAFNYKVIRIDMRQIGGSALTADIPVPKEREMDDSIPITYVPARNTIMLSVALGLSEAIGAQDIFIGVNAVDYSGYPDCRPDFIEAFEKTANLATRVGVEGDKFTIHTPLINLSKAEIIKLGTKLGVDYSLTLSCYDPDKQGRACGKCDTCVLRRQGFEQAGIPDPTEYV
ncbi:MAG: 7-cyano-7-deazaguanine synthase QueC [Chlamydiae bacterium]|nr:MAG: 7-cyano-7-deazaguanine synthase QueC [Chlamydiota bacterium]